MKRLIIRLAYDGTAYHGWQIQQNALTVQQKVNEALSSIFQLVVETIGCGRTDTGVHARDFYIHFDAPELPKSLLIRLNQLLPEDIRVYSVYEAKSDFNVRFAALSRQYCYYIMTTADPFRKLYAWHMHRPLDLMLMNQACNILKQYQDFECFSKVNTQVANFRCHIMHAQWSRDSTGYVFDIKADRFLRNMVRAIVGTMVKVGTGSLSLAGFEAVLASKNRSEAGDSVPPQGLFLEHISYTEGSMLLVDSLDKSNHD